jgi:glycosyltransferase involved in cell wall biosynthesis
MASANALPYMGGVETHVHEVSRRLGAAGVDVTVLTTDRSGALPETEQEDGYLVRRWPAYPRTRDYYLAPGLARHLSRGCYDIVHVQGVHTFIAPAALTAARHARIPSLLTFHTGGHSSPLRGSIRGLQWRLIAPLLRSTAALVAVSEYERNTFADVVGGNADIRLIRNGCERLPVDDSMEPSRGEPLLVSVGRLERYKGHHRILQALPAILAEAPEARLVIAGSGPYEPDLTALANQLGIADRVTICGFGPERRPAMGRLVADADVFCLLSEYESHPVAVMEAIGVGTNALVADTSGMSELGVAGLVTTIDLDASAQQIASAALQLAAAPPPASPTIPTWDDCAEQLHALYREIAR